MSQSSVPYGSEQLPDEPGDGFALPWVKRLTLQSEQLNVEHEAIFEKLNGLLRALNSGDRTRITMACSSLSAEAQAHFTKEEELMLAADYPDSAAHIEQHDELMRRLARIQYILTYGTGSWSPASELSKLKEWFVPHISHADRLLDDFIAARHLADFEAARRAGPDAA